MATKLKGISINGTAYDLDLSRFGDQEAIKFINSVGKVREIRVNSSDELVVLDPENKWSDQVDALNTLNGTATKSNFQSVAASTEVGASYLTNMLRINMLYCGGEGTNMDVECAATHNFVELSNATGEDINLEGIYLLYVSSAAAGSGAWKCLPLKGIIHGGSTFLIRGAQCSAPSNRCVNVDTYDMIWYDSGKPIEFSLDGGTWYLAISQNGKLHDGSSWVEPSALSTSKNPWTDVQTTPEYKGYIDLVGVGNVSAEGNKPVTIKQTQNMKNCLFFRQYGLDKGQATVLKEWKKRTSSGFWTYCDMTQDPTDNVPYFTDLLKQRLQPKASFEGKDFFTTRSHFDMTKPNCVNVTFGKQATAGASGADRCFNWVSPGCYDEYVEYRKVGEADWRKKYSIARKGNHPYTTEYPGDAVVSTFINVYDRYRWISGHYDSVTTHKAIIRGLSSGTYEFRIRRDNDESFISETKQFVVRTNSDVSGSGKSFKFVQTTDQQSFNYNEYQAWAKSAFCIANTEGSFDFSINTGDMSQSGNRESEWIDYFNGRRYMDAITPIEMPIIGNNDLCAPTLYGVANGIASSTKINSISIWLFYCFDLDADNPCIFKYYPNFTVDQTKVGSASNYVTFTSGDALGGGNGVFEYFMPSVYSFNYGNYHFIGLNSEFITNAESSQIIYNDSAFANDIKCNAYYNEYRWLVADYNKYVTSGVKCIVYAHEIPVCISAVTKAYNTETKTGNGKALARTNDNGSKLNFNFAGSDGGTAVKTSAGTTSTDSTTYDGNGRYFSRFFESHNIRLCLGGHKHTYSLTWPLAEHETDAAHPTVKATLNTNYTESGNVKTFPKDASTVYAMCQATGFKLVSNKELPGYMDGEGAANSNWLLCAYPANSLGAESIGQHWPMYATMTCDDNGVHYVGKRIKNINGTDFGASKTSNYNINGDIAVAPEAGTNIGTNTDINGKSGNYADIIIKYV